MFLGELFLFVPFWLQDLFIFDLKIGFLVQNCIYSQPKSKKFPDSRTEKCNFLSYVSTVRKSEEYRGVSASPLLLVFPHAHIKVVVTFFVVNFFGFLVIARDHGSFERRH